MKVAGVTTGSRYGSSCNNIFLHNIIYKKSKNPTLTKFGDLFMKTLGRQASLEFLVGFPKKIA